MHALPLGWDAPASRIVPGFVAAGLVDPSRGEGPMLVTDDGEGHALICAPTGTGKGRAFAIPALLSWPGSVVCIDVKSELYHVTQRHRRSLGPVLVIDPFAETPGRRGAYNPLSSIHPRSAQFIDEVYAIAGLFANPAPAVGPDGRFWEDHATDVIAGLIAHVVSCKDEKHRTLGRVYELLSGGDVVYDLAVLLDTVAKHPFTQAKVGHWLQLPELTRGGIHATIAQQIRTLASPGVRASLARTSLPKRIIQAGAPFTIYLVLPPHMLASHAALLRIIVTGLVQELTRRRHKPEHPTLLIADEAAQIGRVPALVTATTLGRGYGLRIAWLLQSLGQLRATYPQDHEAIQENCSTLMTLGRHAGYSMSRTLADHGFGDVSAETVYRLGPDDAMARTSHMPTRVLRKLDYLRDAMFAGRFDANPLHERYTHRQGRQAAR